ncbi:STAS domain-containing protein [Pokkaliibacter sp. MBI-7]|uniref:STAS domain-containing protein n=1 Tax=Proteobacteria bacterium 228 TaxID=2083153 RepID=A0A2S5KR35_9PROT|nr:MULTISPECIES: STAS domain-containing protein [Pokkaliibacter]MDH2435169.1 STAS domain-containing protein [Pokkaliibacter sp. MBI-7]PPC77163.1 hypothetical protein C4K68_12190 [Pokkaliibacter plantistimulans]
MSTYLSQLPEELTIGYIGSVWNALHDSLQNKSHPADEPQLVIDASAVRLIDTAGVQFLCALDRYARKSGLCLTWKAKSALIDEKFESLGLRRLN